MCKCYIFAKSSSGLNRDSVGASNPPGCSGDLRYLYLVRDNVYKECDLQKERHSRAASLGGDGRTNKLCFLRGVVATQARRIDNNRYIRTMQYFRPISRESGTGKYGSYANEKTAIFRIFNGSIQFFLYRMIEKKEQVCYAFSPPLAADPPGADGSI